MPLQSVGTTQPAWALNLGLPTGSGDVAPAAATSDSSPSAGAGLATPIQNPLGDWNGWTPKHHIEDQAYDAYAFSRFPLNMGGESFWTGGGLRRQVASWVSQIPLARLEAYGVRERFMSLPNMNPDHARLLQMAYDQSKQGTPSDSNEPLRWLARFSGGGKLGDYLVRGPLMIELGIIGAQVAANMAFPPDLPGVSQIRDYAEAAAQYARPEGPVAPSY